MALAIKFLSLRGQGEVRITRSRHVVKLHKRCSVTFASANTAYGSWDWQSEDEEVKQALNAKEVIEALAASDLRNINVEDWVNNWADPVCLNGDYGSWDFDDGTSFVASEKPNDNNTANAPAAPMPIPPSVSKQRPRALASDF